MSSDSGSPTRGSSKLPRVAMKATTVRFGEDLWAMLERESSRLGLSAAQFVREATIMRMGMLAGSRGDPDAELTIADIAARASGRARFDEVAKALAEPGRLAALHDAALLDSAPEEPFDRLARLAARVVNAPVALVSALDRDRQFFKSCLGLPEPWATRRETPLSHSFCQHVVAAREPMMVSDARRDERVLDNLAIRDLGVIAYLGVPLITREGHALGTLCVIDRQPRIWTDDEINLVKDVAAAAVTEITLRGDLHSTPQSAANKQPNGA
jgi:transcriptional regulator with GAF, ATPase, and Fis domain